MMKRKNLSNHEYTSILWLCFVNGQAIGVWGEDGQPTKEELVRVLRQVEEYLRHPDVQAIPFALSAAVPLANVRKLIAVLSQ